MTRNTLALWVSIMVLAGLISSCGGNTATDSLLEESAAPDVVYDDALHIEGMDSPERELSYTPGLHCPLVAGFNNVDIFKYGWKAGNVTENAAPKWVRLTSTNAVKAKILYKFQETSSGRLKSVKVFGQGSRCLIELLNYDTNAYDSFGAHNLSSGPVTINLPLKYAPNGASWLRLTEAVPFTVQVEKIEAQVF